MVRSDTQLPHDRPEPECEHAAIPTHLSRAELSDQLLAIACVTSVHTGLDPLNFTSTINARGGDSSLSADYIFIPRLLQSAGYQSHMLGKARLLSHTTLRPRPRPRLLLP